VRPLELSIAHVSVASVGEPHEEVGGRISYRVDDVRDGAAMRAQIRAERAARAKPSAARKPPPRHRPRRR
jgi:hypothetical protein